jgi:hypothetical protein
LLDPDLIEALAEDMRLVQRKRVHHAGLMVCAFRAPKFIAHFARVNHGCDRIQHVSKPGLYMSSPVQFHPRGEFRHSEFM